MSGYRICHNTAPHQKDWWTVEKKRRGLFGRTFWCPAKQHYGHGLSTVRRFASEAEAEAWVAEDQRPTTHTCRAA